MENTETKSVESPTLAARNDAIAKYYVEGHKLGEVSSHFKLGKQRVIQILKGRGVWKPYPRGGRTKFLGVTVKEETKDRLTKLAEEKGVSVSKLTSDVLDETVEKQL